MRIFSLFTLSLLIASNAFAQAVSPYTQDQTTAPAATTASPFAPSTPVVQPVTMAPAGVTSTPAVPASTTLATTPTPAAAPAQTMDLNGMLGKLAGNSNSQQKLGQVMVIGSILGCTQKTAGKPQTDAFYQEMQALGKTVQGYCKQNNAALARTTVLQTLNAKHNDPVVKAMLTCYDAQKANVQSLGGQQVATDAEHYARWLRNPTLASQEMQESDVCRNSK